jgi:anti-anti-sigma factor
MLFGKSTPVSILILSDPKKLKEVRQQVLEATQSAGFDDPLQGRIVLAVDEAITNIIRHGYHGAADKEIQIALFNDEDALRISIRDFADKPDVSKIASRDLKDVRPGGLGCHFIREIMDEVEYDVTTHKIGTELKLVKFKATNLQPKRRTMKINLRSKEGSEILDIQGDIDLYTSPQLRDRFQELAAQKKGTVIANLKNVSYIDSSGLATFIEAYQRLSQAKGRLILCHLNATVKSVFEIARLEDVLTLAATEEEALKLAKGARAS